MLRSTITAARRLTHMQPTWDSHAPIAGGEGARGRTSLRHMNTTALGTTAVSTGARPHPLPAAARVLLVGDVRLFLELLEQALPERAGVEVVGVASCDVAAMAAGMVEPDVVVVDTASLTTPGGLQVLATALPGAKIVGVGVPADDDLIVALLEAGAAGYVTAEQQFSDLVGALEAAANGELRC